MRQQIAALEPPADARMGEHVGQGDHGRDGEQRGVAQPRQRQEEPDQRHEPSDARPLRKDADQRGHVAGRQRQRSPADRLGRIERGVFQYEARKRHGQRVEPFPRQRHAIGVDQGRRGQGRAAGPSARLSDNRGFFPAA